MENKRRITIVGGDRIGRALGALLQERLPDVDIEQSDMREYYAERRYQEPTRLRGAAAQKRQAKKMKNKSRSKRK